VQDGHALLHFAYSRKNKKRQSANVRAILEDGVGCLLSDDDNSLEKSCCLPKQAVNSTVKMRESIVKMRNSRGKIGCRNEKMQKSTVKMRYSRAKAVYSAVKI